VTDQKPAREHHRTHFTRRLEAFSDIVFGLCLAQSAVQLAVPDTLHGLVGAHGVMHLFVFFATFAIISVYWLSHYRMFRLAFEPNRLDVFLNFAFLALTALLPFTMQVNIKFSGAPIALSFYALNLMLTSIVMATLVGRGLARRDPTLTAEERLGLWQAVLRNRMIVVAATVALVSLWFVQEPWTGMAGFAFMLMLPATICIRRRVKSVPLRFLPSGDSR
jgi:uncharacterized membrane protein